MKLFLYVLTGSILLFLSNCGGTHVAQNTVNQPETRQKSEEKADTPYKPRETGKPEQVLVYCDLTSSLKKEGAAKISDKLKQILLNLPRGSFANIRLVEKNLLSDNAFSELKTPEPCKVEDSTIKRKKLEAEEKCRDTDLKYAETVEDISQKLQTLKPEVDESCIIDTLEASHDFFKNKDSQKYNFQLIYLSDMIEQCKDKSLFICSSKRTPNKSELLEKLGRDFKPAYDLNSVVNENLSIIITTNDEKDAKCLTLPEQKEFWGAVFGKIGYSNPQMSDFNYTQEIPDKLRSK